MYKPVEARLVVCVFVAVAAIGCGVDAHDNALRTVQIYDLLIAYPRARMDVRAASYTSRGIFLVGGEARHAILLHPESELEFGPVRVSADAMLTFKIGVDDQAWSKAGDGVEFMVYVVGANTAKKKVFSRYVDPKHVSEDRRWIDGRVSLRSFGSQQVGIILATGPGPLTDFAYDWALWAEPQLVFSGKP